MNSRVPARLASDAGPTIGIVACGAVVREMVAIANRQGWNYRLTAVPAQLHNRPARIAPAVQQAVDDWIHEFDLILLGYADCGTGGALDALIEEYATTPKAATQYASVVRIAGPHCYEFYGGAHFETAMDDEPGTFFLTDFLARHFDGLVWRGLGLDRFPELLPDYFAHYRQVIYLRQTEDAQAGAVGEEYAQAAAARLGLPLRVVDTGLATLEARLVAVVHERLARLGKPLPMPPTPKAVGA